MSNPLKGAVHFDIDGEKLSISYSAEALYRLEKQLGKSAAEIGQMMQKSEEFNMELVRIMFWAGLLDTHEGLGVDDVGRFFRRLPMMEAVKLVTGAFGSAFADPDAPPPEAAAANPQ